MSLFHSLSIFRDNRYKTEPRNSLTSTISRQKYESFFSDTALNQKLQLAGQLKQIRNDTTMINLADATPDPSIYPFKEVSLTLKDGRIISIHSDKLSRINGPSDEAGDRALIHEIREIQSLEHNNPYKDFSVIVGNTNYELLSKIFEVLLNPGDSILLCSPTQTEIQAELKYFGINCIELKSDENGIIPEDIEQNFSSGKGAKILYTVPVGNDPTGGITSLERKKEIYKLAQKHDFLIIEDDPYYFYQFPNNTSLPISRIPSYYSIDNDPIISRVIRVDSFSGTLAGAPIAWITAPKEICAKVLVLKMNCSQNGPNELTQSIVSELFKTWRLQEDRHGFFDALDQECKFYHYKRDAMLRILELQLSCIDFPVALWSVPKAGFFIWVEILPSKNSDNFKSRFLDSFDFLKTKCLGKKVIIYPGVEFFPNNNGSTSFFRLSFAARSEHNFAIGISRIVEMLIEWRKLVESNDYTSLSKISNSEENVVLESSSCPPHRRVSVIKTASLTELGAQ